MERIVSILIRRVESGFSHCCNFFRILYLLLKYPGAKIDFNSKIGKNCKVICVDGGSLRIINSSVAAGTHIFVDVNADMSITDSVIGRNCCIVAKKSIVINSGCAIAEMVVIRDQDHIVNVNQHKNSFDEYNIGAINIGENVWIASKATILKNVSIGNFAVIAASAVVNKNVPKYEVWGGVPAKFLKNVYAI